MHKSSGLKKIISGGQTGADRAALDAAIEMGKPYGGWLPKGRMTEDGPLPHSYIMEELSSGDYRQRTEKNVIESDATLIVSHGLLTGGSLLTGKLARKHGKPHLHINCHEVSPAEAIPIAAGWLLRHNVEVLNVAGPRASGDTAIYGVVKVLISGLLLLPHN